MALRFDRIEITGTSTSESTPSITNSSGELVRFQTSSGYIDIGANNTGYAHFYTDRGKFYFSKKLIVDEGMISAYNEDLTLAVNDGANAAITIDKDSPYNVGIGTTTPFYKLDVNGTFRSTGAGEIQGRLSVGTSSSSDIDMLRAGGNYITATNAAGILYFRTVDDIRMTILSGGNVGIGTLTPSEKLEVVGNILVDKGTSNRTAYVSDDGIYISRNSDGNYVNSVVANSSNSNYLDVKARSRVNLVLNNSDVLTAVDTGNVGIGTTSPSAKLEVDSNDQYRTVQLTGTSPGIYFNEDDSASTANWHFGVNNGNLYFLRDTDKNGVANSIAAYFSGSDFISNAGVYSVGNIFAFGGSTSPGEYITRSGNDIRLVAGGNTVMTVDGNGSNVGIGTTDPQSTLQTGDILGSNSLNLVRGDVDFIGSNKDITDIQAGTLNISSTTRSSSAPYNQGNGPSLTFTQSGNAFVDGWDKVIGGIKTEIKNPTHMDFRSIMQFYTHDNTALSPRMTIDNDGNVGIGTDSPEEKLHVNGDIMLSDPFKGRLRFKNTSFPSLQSSIKSNTSGDIELRSLNDTLVLSAKNNTDVLIPAGNVGINQTNPETKFHVFQNANVGGSAGNFEKLRTLQNSGGSGGNNVYVREWGYRNSAGTDWTTWTYHNGISVDSSYGTPLVDTKTFWHRDPQADKQYFGGGSDKVLTIQGGGGTNRVGIGTTSPQEKLAVDGSIRIPRTEEFYWTDGSINGNARAVIFSTDNEFTGDYNGIGFSVGANGRTAPSMYIRSTGNVGIGTALPGYKLHVNGGAHATIYYMGSTSTSIADFFSYIDLQASNGVLVRSGNTYKPILASAFTVSSDYRLKSNIVPLENAIDRLNQLEARRFNWNDRLNEPKVDGFIAHEVAPIIPEAVLGEKDAVHEDGTPNHQGIDQAKIVPLLTAALQEAISKIENLESRIQILENQ